MFRKYNKLNLQKGILLAILLLLGGCSASFTYNNIGWLSGFWIDDYVDLNKQQSKTVKALIKDTRDWHRETQLPLYKQDLIHFQTLLAGSPTEQALLTHFNNAKEHWQIFVNKIAEPLIRVAKTLNTQQRQQFIESISKNMLEEQQEFTDQTSVERSEARLEEQLDTYEDWIGKLSQSQVALITVANNEHISTFSLWQRYKQARLDALSNIFNNSLLTDSEFNQQMAHVIKERQAFMSAELIDTEQQNLARYVKLLVDLKGTLTTNQLDHADKKFSEMIEDIDDLLKD